MNVASSWTPPRKGRLFELRQDHLHSHQNLTSFFKEPGLVSARALGVSLLIRCPREVSVTSQRKVESRNDRAENAWGLGWVSVLSWI